MIDENGDISKTILQEVQGAYRDLTLSLIEKKLTIATMESCTSGLVASLLSDTEGASSVLTGGFVTYCNAAKIAAGVPASVIEERGVYSLQTAVEMAMAARRDLGTRIGIGVTGTFSNADPANADSIPGLVWFAIDIDGDVRCTKLELAALPDRFTYKLITARRIAAVLKERLKEWAL